MKILMINDDYWHPAKVSNEGVKPLETSGYHFDILSDGADFAAGKLAGYDVVMHVKGNNRTAEDKSPWLTDEVAGALAAYVKQGGGLLVVHSGTTGYAGNETMRALVGATFMTHPKQLPVTYEPQPGHPLTAGAAAFTQTDEHYFLDMTDQPVDVFLRSRSRHGLLPAGWTKHEGRGRVCVLAPGHNVEVWLDPSFQRLLANALDWCAAK